MKTIVKPPKEDFAKFAAQMARNPETLAAFEEAMKGAERKREIGRRVAEERVRLGLTQEQVCERAGLGTRASTVRKYQSWEAGDHLPSADMLEAVADALKTSYDYLVTGGEQAPPPADILRRLDQLHEALQALAVGQVEILEGQAELAVKLDELQKSQGRGRTRRANDG